MYIILEEFVCCRLKSCWLNCSNVGSKDKQAVFRLWWVKNLDLSSQLLQTFIILMYWASIREKSFSWRREVSVFKCMVHSECVFSAPKISTLKRPLAIALFFIFLKKNPLCISQSAYFIAWISKSFQGLLVTLFSFVFSLLMSNPLEFLWHAFFFLVFLATKKDRCLFILL